MLLETLECNQEVHKESQNLIKTLCTNPNMFWNVLWLNNRPEDQRKFNWEMVFNPDDIKVTMYTLEIVDSILTNTTCQVDPASAEGELRTNWVERFLRQGGFEQLMILLEKALHLSRDQLGQVQIASEVGNTIKKFLNFMLRITKVFIMAAIKAAKTAEEAETIHLLRKHSSVSEAQKKKVKKAKKADAGDMDTDGF